MAKKQTEKAIEVLNDLKNELKSKNTEQDCINWKLKALASIKLYIDDTNILESFQKIQFYSRKNEIIEVNTYWGKDKTHSFAVYDATKKKNAADIIDNIIQHINIHGVINSKQEQREQINFLSEISNLKLFGMISAFAVACFSFGCLTTNIGFTIDKNKYSAEITKQTNEIKLYQDSITTLRLKLKY